MAKKLTKKAIQDYNKRFNEIESATVSLDHEEFEIKYYPYLPPIKVKEMLDDVVQSMNLQQEKGVETPDHLLFDYIYYFVLKHFTKDIYFPPTNKPKEVIQHFRAFLNTPVYEELLNLFPKDELGKVGQRVIDTLNEYEKFQRQAKKMQGELQERLNEMEFENEELEQRVKNQKQIPEV